MPFRHLTIGGRSELQAYVGNCNLYAISFMRATNIRLSHDNYQDGMIVVQPPWAKAVSGNYKKERQKCMEK